MIEIEKEIDNHRILYFKKGTNILHREDGPAIEYGTGLKEWFFNGERHRDDGPAIIYTDGSLGWWLYGIYFNKKEDWFETLAEEERLAMLYSEYFIGG